MMANIYVGQHLNYHFSNERIVRVYLYFSKHTAWNWLNVCCFVFQKLGLVSRLSLWEVHIKSDSFLLSLFQVVDWFIFVPSSPNITTQRTTSYPQHHLTQRITTPYNTATYPAPLTPPNITPHHTTPQFSVTYWSGLVASHFSGSNPHETKKKLFRVSLTSTV